MPKTVLIVDDHSDTRIICRELLTHFGYRAIEASNGEEALAMARQYRPDMVLLDFLMPERDGLEVLNDLRSAAETAGIPIVLFTAAASRLEELTSRPGVAQVLVKPLEAARLLRTVAEVIGAAEMPATPAT